MYEPLHEENEVWLPLHEAAEALGISPRAVQLRAEKGKIRRERQDGRVVFFIAASRTVHVENEVPHEALHEESEAVHEAETKPDPVYVVHLETEVEFLREQVRTHQQNEAELRRLMLADKHELNALREKVTLLLAAPSIEETSSANLTELNTRENNGMGETAVQDTAASPPEALSAKIDTDAEIPALELEQAENRLNTEQETVRPKRWWEVWRKD